MKTKEELELAHLYNRALAEAGRKDPYSLPFKYHKKSRAYVVQRIRATAKLPAMYEVFFEGNDRSLRPNGIVEKRGEVFRAYGGTMQIIGAVHPRSLWDLIGDMPTMDRALGAIRALAEEGLEDATRKPYSHRTSP
jgi:hypothetical protein